MNKTIFFLILAVCILGMALILLNQRLGRDPEPRPAARAGQSIVAEAPGTDPAPVLREDAGGPDAGPDAGAAGAASAPAVPPAPSLEAGGQRNAAARQDPETSRPARDREATGAAADALALERKEAEAALRGTPPAPATPPAPRRWRCWKRCLGTAPFALGSGRWCRRCWRDGMCWGSCPPGAENPCAIRSPPCFFPGLLW